MFGEERLADSFAELARGRSAQQILEGIQRQQGHFGITLDIHNLLVIAQCPQIERIFDKRVGGIQFNEAFQRCHRPRIIIALVERPCRHDLRPHRKV
ncbi:MAG: Uncharacterised protein [SAR116 cluster bacterium]|nr:MAG: Uncharacterised protein [SAR116 cluster bacterium]